MGEDDYLDALYEDRFGDPYSFEDVHQAWLDMVSDEAYDEQVPLWDEDE